MHVLTQNLLRYWLFIKSIGVTPQMDEYEKRKMGIFNKLNTLGIATGIILPLIGIFNNDHLPGLAWFVATSPLAISVFVLWLSYEQYSVASRMVYFSLYPVATTLVYLGQVNVGIELFFILYGVLSVFFFQNILSILFCYSLSIACYFVSTLMPRAYYFRLETVNNGFYLFNHILALGFIFYALYLIKEENTGYQFSLLRKSRQLHHRNREIEKQKQEIAEKAGLLEQQTQELTELNQIKNKLFSVIAHDLKTPMYAMRNLFDSMQKQNLSSREIKQLLPAIVNEMNYTTSLMENLLNWAKTQMKNDAANPEVLDIQSMINEVMQLLHLQATNKRINLESNLRQPVHCFADREMVNLVLRNLMSNAIKFTPEQGQVIVGAAEKSNCVEIFIKDNGVGMSDEDLNSLFADRFYTTRGTSNEAGTGLGLKLCKEYLHKNGGEIKVTSELGKGSIFYFTLPRHQDSA
jgi:two-component system, sensor histidine kinase and response regulator